MTKDCSVTWKSWYGDEEFEIQFPDHRDIEVCKMKDAPELDEEQIKTAFENPVGTQKTRELAKGRKSTTL